MDIEFEILQASYWEHFKKAKDLALYLPIEDERRIELEKELQNMLIRINKLKHKNSLVY